VIDLLRELFSDTINFVHRQVLQISALHILLREVLFTYKAVEKPVGGGYIPSRLIKVLVTYKDEYAILADVLREARAKNNRDSSMDDEDLHSRTSEETYRAQRTRKIERDDKKSFQYQASADDKMSAPSDAGSDQKVNMEGLAQRTIRSENKINISLLTSQSRLRLTDENIFQQPLTSSLKKIWLATHHTEAGPLQ
jgi:hypothetical protein